MITLTPQEITHFVSQPIPRKVPEYVYRAVLYAKNSLEEYRILHNIWCFLIFFPIILSSILLIDEIGFPFRDLLLDFGNKTITQGTVISWERDYYFAGNASTRSKIEYYKLRVRFSTPNGSETVNCYVTYKSTEFFSKNTTIRRGYELFENQEVPFPVTVEYIHWFPYAARAVGTYARINTFFFYRFTLFSIPFLIFAYFSPVSRDLRKYIRFLKKGRFVAGRVTKINMHSAEYYTHNYCSVVVSFYDRNALRLGYSGVPRNIAYKCNRLSHEVGVLYLPNVDEVLITDLWTDDRINKSASCKDAIAPLGAKCG